MSKPGLCMRQRDIPFLRQLDSRGPSFLAALASQQYRPDIQLYRSFGIAHMFKDISIFLVIKAAPWPQVAARDAQAQSMAWADVGAC